MQLHVKGRSVPARSQSLSAHEPIRLVLLTSPMIPSDYDLAIIAIMVLLWPEDHIPATLDGVSHRESPCKQAPCSGLPNSLSPISQVLFSSFFLLPTFAHTQGKIHPSIPTSTHHLHLQIPSETTTCTLLLPLSTRKKKKNLLVAHKTRLDA